MQTGEALEGQYVESQYFVHLVTADRVWGEDLRGQMVKKLLFPKAEQRVQSEQGKHGKEGKM